MCHRAPTGAMLGGLFAMSRLQDKVAIVTGAAQGIGAAYARALAAAGATVVIVDVIEPTSLLGEIEAAGGRAIGRVTDVADPAAVAALVAATIDAFGKIDILVNNAAMFGQLGLRRFEEIPSDEWD